MLVKLPEVVLLDVLLSDIVGFWFVLQQTPLDVIISPPLSLIFPLAFSDVVVILVGVVVDIVGIDLVFILIWLPYDVPTLFTEYALI